MVSNVSSSSSGSQLGSQVTGIDSLLVWNKSVFLFLFFIKVDTAWVSSCHSCRRLHRCTSHQRGAHSFQVEGQIIEANFTACTLNGKLGFRVNFLRCEANLSEDRVCQIFHGHKKVDMVLFC